MCIEDALYWGAKLRRKTEFNKLCKKLDISVSKKILRGDIKKHDVINCNFGVILVAVSISRLGEYYTNKLVQYLSKHPGIDTCRCRCVVRISNESYL